MEGEERERLQPKIHAIALAPGQPQHRLLIVDDKPDNRTLLVKLLQPLGFTLREATNGQEAMTFWKIWEPHLIWMDVRMPVMGGYEATHQIRAHAKGNETVIIAVSASSLEDERAVALSNGCNDFLRKPFHEADIFDLLQKHIGVQFVYEECRERVYEDERKKASPLTPKALSLLQKNWYLSIKHAVEELDLEATKQGIQHIQSQHPQLAAQLTEFVQQYRFDLLQELFAAAEDDTGQREEEDNV